MGPVDVGGHSAAAAQSAVCQRAGALPRGGWGASVSLWCCPAHIHITGLYITSDPGMGNAGLRVSIIPELWGLRALHCPLSEQVGHNPNARLPSTGGGFQTPGCGPLNGSSCLICKVEEQGGRLGVCIAIPYPW